MSDREIYLGWSRFESGDEGTGGEMVDRKKPNWTDWPTDALEVYAKQCQRIRNLRNAIKGYERYVKYSKLMLKTQKELSRREYSTANHWRGLAYQRELERRRTLRNQRIWIAIAFVLFVALIFMVAS